jgi:hypothetical protein
MGEPANTEQESPLAFAVAQFVFAEPGPGGQWMLYTRLGCAANVRKVLAFATEGTVKVRSGLLTVTPSPVNKQPGEPSTPEQPAKLRPVPFVTFEFPPPMAAGSLLKMTLFSDTVTFDEDPVRRVPVTLAEAFETNSKPPAAHRLNIPVLIANFSLRLYLQKHFNFIPVISKRSTLGGIRTTSTLRIAGSVSNPDGSRLRAEARFFTALPACFA